MIEQLPERIRAQREGIGFTVREAAERASLDDARVQAIESGAVTPTLYELSRLAHAIGIDPMALLDEQSPLTNPRLNPARFRAQQGATLAPTDRRLLSVAAALGRVGFGLRQMLQLAAPRARVGHVRLEHQTAPWVQGYELGVRARQELFPERAPILDLVGAIEGLGIHVAFAGFQDARIEAATVAERQALPVILLNVNARRVQRPHTRRAILAHELCHVLHDGNRRADPITSVSYVSREGEEGAALEQRANGFAPAFLAPPFALHLDLSAQQQAETLVRDWYFSVEGAIWHVKNLYRLSSNDARTLKEDLTPRLRTRPILFDRPIPEHLILAAGLVERLVGQAVDRDLITEGRRDEILSLA